MSSVPSPAPSECVTGLSKARKQVMNATEKFGGQYSPNLHPQCTHLVVQSYKYEHALKHGLRNGLLVVTLGWFVDSVRRNGECGVVKVYLIPFHFSNSCLALWKSIHVGLMSI
ncbi:uncharacterized protein LOC113337454 isoform X2 [Papaver somniferum]|uniref:uncharacterized protein LOC113337454 isoform X2 n=1 Tax=Papaver somniferum TaxID=3469 RepID=UPI000E6FF528|nr:uncharacterized protein LOC113337454 isoform X2 [Papaver somniferum]